MQTDSLPGVCQAGNPDLRHDTLKDMSEASKSTSSGLDLDLSGRQMGDYRLLRRLGRGAMAEVYLAEQMSLRRQVAVKVLKRELADRRHLRRRVSHGGPGRRRAGPRQHRADLRSGLRRRHPLHRPGIRAGQNLRELLARRGPPDVKLAVAIMRQVAAALAQGGRAGHRPSRHQAREHHARRAPAR